MSLSRNMTTEESVKDFIQRFGQESVEGFIRQLERLTLPSEEDNITIKEEENIRIQGGPMASAQMYLDLFKERLSTLKEQKRLGGMTSVQLEAEIAVLKELLVPGMLQGGRQADPEKMNNKISALEQQLKNVRALEKLEKLANELNLESMTDEEALASICTQRDLIYTMFAAGVSSATININGKSVTLHDYLKQLAAFHEARREEELKVENEGDDDLPAIQTLLENGNWVVEMYNQGHDSNYLVSFDGSDESNPLGYYLFNALQGLNQYLAQEPSVCVITEGDREAVEKLKKTLEGLDVEKQQGKVFDDLDIDGEQKKSAPVDESATLRKAHIEGHILWLQEGLDCHQKNFSDIVAIEGKEATIEEHLKILNQQLRDIEADSDVGNSVNRGVDAELNQQSVSSDGEQKVVSSSSFVSPQNIPSNLVAQLSLRDCLARAEKPKESEVPASSSCLGEDKHQANAVFAAVQESKGAQLYERLREVFMNPALPSYEVDKAPLMLGIQVRVAIEQHPLNSKQLLGTKAQLENLSFMLEELEKLDVPEGEFKNYLSVVQQELREKEKDFKEKYEKYGMSSYSNGPLKQEIIAATQLAFHLVFKAKALTAASAEDVQHPNGSSFESINSECGKQVAKKLCRFNGWKFAAGIAIAIFGIAVVATAGVALAASCGATFGAAGVFTPIFITMAKFGFEAGVAGVLYAFAEAVRGRSRLSDAALVGAAATGAGALAVDANILAVNVAGTTVVKTIVASPAVATAGAVGLSVGSITTGFAALARGIHTMWNSRAAGDSFGVHANRVLNATNADIEPAPAPVARPSQG